MDLEAALVQLIQIQTKLERLAIHLQQHHLREIAAVTEVVVVLLVVVVVAGQALLGLTAVVLVETVALERHQP